MKILSVHLKDFLSVGEAEFKLNDQGLVLVQGLNEDNPSASSNGSGKSSLVDGVCWALYGETARGVPANQVVRQGAKKAVATVIFEDDAGDVFWVSRDRTKTKGTLLFDQVLPTTNVTLAVLTQGTDKLTQEAITRKLGASYEVFRAAVYIGQEQMPDLPSMTDKKLKELIEEAAGVGIIEAAYAEAREQFRAAQGELARRELAHQQSKITCDRLKTEFDDLFRREADWAMTHTHRISEEFKSLTLVKNQREAFQKAGSGVAVPAATLSVALSQVEGKLAGFSAAQAEERRLATEANRLAGALSVAQHQEKAAESALSVARFHCTDAHDQEGKPCASCGQALTKSALESALKGARHAEGVAEAALVAAQEARTTADAAAHAVGVALAAHRASMGDPSLLQAQAAKIRSALGEIEAHERALADYDARIKAIENALERMRVETNPISPLLDAKSEELDKATLAMKTAEQALEVQESEVLTAESVVQVFGPAGVRAQVLDKVTPYLNDRTAAYLTSLSDGTLTATWTTLVKNAKGELKEQFAIEITHPAGEGFAGLSGGEKRKIRLACGMALQDLVASRASKPFKLWVLDECDEALDEAGLERLMTVLNEKAKEKGTVLVISHRSLTDWIGNVWTVTKRAGVSGLDV